MHTACFMPYLVFRGYVPPHSDKRIICYTFFSVSDIFTDCLSVHLICFPVFNGASITHRGKSNGCYRSSSGVPAALFPSDPPP